MPKLAVNNAQAAIKVLLVEDNAVDARLLQLLLGEATTTEHHLSRVERLSLALDTLAKTKFDVVLLDLTLPDSQGFETFQRMRAAAPNTPILVLSGMDDENLAVRAVREGAQDYLVKGRIDAYILLRAISYAIERHQSERALQESERHYKFLLESITDYTYSVKLLNGHPATSTHGPGCITVTGYKPKDYQADPQLWYRMVHEEDRPAVLAQIQQILGGQTPAPLEHRILHKSGQVRWVRNTVLPFRDNSGILAGYEGLIADITARKLAEEKLVASEAFYHSLVENLPQNILRKDLSERFTFANQRFCALLNKRLEDIIGKTDFDFYPPELATKFQRDDRYVIETGHTFETVEENQSPSGEKIFVQVIKTPILDAKNQVIGIQCIFWDITERKRWEERLQQANEELALSEAALRKSHQELKAAQLQLIQAEKMESIGTLAAGVAHEVKNPLATIMMGINYLAKRITAPDENVASVLKEMKDAIDRADKITRGLLDFAATQLDVENLEINDLIENSLRILRHEFSKRDISVHKQFAAGLPQVAVDRGQIQQVLINLCMNAAQSMPTGGQLKVRTYSKQLAETTHFEGSRKAARIWIGDTVVVTEVEDTGTGIPEEFLAKIFDPFFTTKPTGIGTGLGLPVSKKIIELHGGTINIKNMPEGGVRVTVMLKANRTSTL